MIFNNISSLFTVHEEQVDQRKQGTIINLE